MHTVQLYIDEELDTPALQRLRKQLMSLPHIVDVELNLRDHHDLLVEYEEMGGMPMSIINNLRQAGLHADIISA